MKRFILFAFLLFTFLFPVTAQEKPFTISVNGYLSVLQSSLFDSLSGPFMNENILHNRLNIIGSAGKHLTFEAGFRNRLFTGDLVRMIPGYADGIAVDNGLADLSWNLLNENSFLLNTTADRLFVDYANGKFQARIGRQRINWGQSLVWNPNDIFNTWSFFDIDYPERPGCDAVRLQYYPTASSAAEFALKSDHDGNITAAGLYRFNAGAYDIQFLGGYSEGKDLVIGTGWSGQIGSISFRGEGSWFYPLRDESIRKKSLIITAGLDKTFGNGSMAQLQLMYCNDPLKPDNLFGIWSGSLTTRDLAFSRFSAFGLFSYPLTPLLTVTASAMYFPDLKGYYGGFNVDYSMAENCDLSVIYQHFDGKTGGESNSVNMAFLRIKFSF